MAHLTVMPTSQKNLEDAMAALEAQRTVLGDAVVDAALEPLRKELERAHASSPSQSLRQVSILFLDVVGSTALSRRLDPEDVHAVMDNALARCTTVVSAHGGRVLQYAGDNLLAVFGADETREDDAANAVRCGLALLALGRDLANEVRLAHAHEGFNVRVGVHTGRVLLGGGIDAEGSIRGDPVNVAARMEQTAPAGGLRISHDTYRLVRGLFDVEAQPPLLVKGVDTPLVTYVVARAVPHGFRVATRGIEGIETRMIGRDAELDSLKCVFRDATEQRTGLRSVFVIGDAGVGKSRLLYELESWIETSGRRCVALQARAVPSSKDRAYGLLRDVIAGYVHLRDGKDLAAAKDEFERSATAILRSDADPSEAIVRAHLLGQLIGFDFSASPHIAAIGGDPRQIRDQGFHAAVEWLRCVAQRSELPVVLQLDDLHWADDASLDFIEHLLKAKDVPLLMLVLTRSELHERRPHFAVTAPSDTRTNIQLRPLDDESSGRLVTELLQKLDNVPPPLRRLVTERASGSPFFMEELIKMLVDEHVIEVGDERWTVDTERLAEIPVPSTLTGVLQARIDRLPPAEKNALQLASVVGVTFWDAALAHVDASTPVALPRLQTRGLIALRQSPAALSPDDDVREYGFAHQLLHQVVYDTVLKRVKRAAHERVADWMVHHAGPRTKSLVGSAAEHYDRAGNQMRAAELHAEAARYMAHLFANEAALQHATRGLELAPEADTDLRWSLLRSRERMLEILGRRDDQRRNLAMLRSLADAAPAGTQGDARRSEVAYLHADFAHRTADRVTQEREARMALSLAERAGSDVLALRAMQRLAQALAYQGNAAEGRDIAAEGFARALELDLAAEISGLNNALTVCTDALGDRVAGLRQSLFDLHHNREVGDRRNVGVALSNVGMSYMAFGAYEDAGEHLNDALQLNRVLGAREIEGNSHAMLSELAWRQGDGALALEHAQKALAISTDIGSRLHDADALWSMGNAYLTLGETENAVNAFARSEAIARELSSMPLALNALEGQARTALMRGDLHSAKRIADRLREEAGAGTDYAGTYEHLLRLTLYRVDQALGAASAAARLDEAHAALMAEAERIDDANLRCSFLARVDEHRKIVEHFQHRLDSRGAG